MTDKKFTQKDIIKALECCINDDCDNCPCECNNGFGNLAELSLDLIYRLKTRIVRYQLKNTNQRNALASLNKKVAEQKADLDLLSLGLSSAIMEKDELFDMVAEQKAEIDELKEENKKYREICEKAIKTYKETKSEAINEFWDKLKAHSRKMHGSDFSGEFWDRAILVEDGDNLVKEMTEGK